MKPLLRLPPRSALAACLAAALQLCGCEPEPAANTLEVVYDSERYQIRLHQQRLSVFDHRLQQNVFTSPVDILISARQTTLSPAKPPTGVPQEHTTHSCTGAVIDKAEPSSQHLLLSGSFTSPDCPVRFGLHFAQAGTRLQLTMTTNDDAYNHLTLGFEAPLDETILGFGAQSSHLDFKGLEVPVWAQPQGIGRGHQPVATFIGQRLPGSTGSDLDTDYPLPYFLSSAQYSVFLDNPEYSRFDFRQRQLTRIHAYSNTLRAQITSCERLPDCITRYSHVSGRMKTLPAWTQQGAIIGLSGAPGRALQHYRQLHDSQVPVAALWLNGLEEAAPEEIKPLRQQLQTDQVRLLGYFTPYLLNEAAADTALTPYQEARDKGYLVKNAAGEVYTIEVPAAVAAETGAGSREAALVDLTNPDAFRWLQTRLKQRIKAWQLSGWLADYGAALPADAQLHDSRDPLHLHNQFPLEWARLNRQLLQDAGPDAVLMMRAGFTSAPALVSAVALGTQNTSWDAHDGLQSAMIGLLNSGVSGLSLSHTDVGGTTSLSFPVSELSHWLLPKELAMDNTFALRRSPELLQRWVELSAFTALLRTSEGLTPGINAQVYESAALRKHFADNVRLFQALTPYRQELMREAEQKGWPLVRHPLLHFPGERRLQAMSATDLQFMLGDSVMIAPMLTPMAQRAYRPVFLPEGEWLELGSGRQIVAGKQGRLLQLSPPPGHAPAYLRNNERTRELILPALQQAGFMPAEITPDEASPFTGNLNGQTAAASATKN